VDGCGKWANRPFGSDRRLPNLLNGTFEAVWLIGSRRAPSDIIRRLKREKFGRPVGCSRDGTGSSNF